MNFMIRLTVLIFIALFISGCVGVSAPTRLYLFSSEGELSSCSSSASQQLATVSVGPVSIARYLDRTGIVTEMKTPLLSVGEFDLWAEPLSDGLTRSLVGQLTGEREGICFIASPWASNVSGDYQIIIDLIELRTTSEGDAFIDVRWWLKGRGTDRLIPSRVFQSSERLSGVDAKSVVIGYDALVKQFAQEILLSLPRGNRLNG